MPQLYQHVSISFNMSQHEVYVARFREARKPHIASSRVPRLCRVKTWNGYIRGTLRPFAAWGMSSNGVAPLFSPKTCRGLPENLKAFQILLILLVSQAGFAMDARAKAWPSGDSNKTYTSPRAPSHALANRDPIFYFEWV